MMDIMSNAFSWMQGSMGFAMLRAQLVSSSTEHYYCHGMGATRHIVSNLSYLL